VWRATQVTNNAAVRPRQAEATLHSPAIRSICITLKGGALSAKRLQASSYNEKIAMLNSGKRWRIGSGPDRQEGHPRYNSNRFDSTLSADPKGRDVKQKQQLKDWLESGLARHRQNDLVGAVNFYQQVLKTSPNEPKAQHYLGLALYQLGQQAMGIHLMRQSLAALPDDASLHLNYVKALQTVDASAALQHVCELAARMPANADVVLSCAQALQAQSRPDEAASVLERLHALAPPSADSLNLLAVLYYHADRLAAARHCHRQAVQLDPAVARQYRIGYALPAAQDGKAKMICAERNLYVLDDCVDDAAAYRAQALASEFKHARYAGQNYPGLQTDGMDCQPIMDRIAAVLRRPIKAISPDNGAFRLSFAHSTARTDIHVDNETGESGRVYAAVLYLNRPEQ